MDIIPSKFEISQLNQYKNDYTETFDLDKVKSVSLNTSKESVINFFKKGKIPELDTIENKIKTTQNIIFIQLIKVSLFL